MPVPGQILHYKNFEFPDDHSKKNKLFVVLNDTDKHSICLVLKTTSQSGRYEGADKGCNPHKRAFFVPINWEHCFKVNTYIQLPQIIPILSDTLLVGDISGKISITGSLSVECRELLWSCLRIFKSDISEEHWNIIFRKKR